jgi:hypothetical protein
MLFDEIPNGLYRRISLLLCLLCYQNGMARWRWGILQAVAAAWPGAYAAAFPAKL